MAVPKHDAMYEYVLVLNNSNWPYRLPLKNFYIYVHVALPTA